MSITGHSNPLRGKRRTSSASSGQLPQGEFVLTRAEHDVSTRSTDDAKQFSLKQSALKRSLPPRVHLDLMQTSLAASRDTQREINKPASKQGHDAQDISPIQPRQCTDIRTLEKSNEIRHLISVNGFQHELTDVKKSAIVVVHQRAFFRDCFVRCLEISYKSHDIFAFASISSWRESNKENALTPSVVVFFADVNDASSISDLQFLEFAAADTPVVIMSDIDDVNYVTRALKGGARGYIPTSLSFNVAVEAVRLVEAGGTFIPASSLDREKFGTTSRANDLLTERQLMVVEALCQGMANKQIAYELSMSEHTVKVHLRHIMRKLNARNRTEVAVLTKDFF